MGEARTVNEISRPFRKRVTGPCRVQEYLAQPSNEFQDVKVIAMPVKRIIMIICWIK